MPEAMAEYPKLMSEAQGQFKIIERSGRVFWSNRTEEAADVFDRWILAT